MTTPGSTALVRCAAHLRGTQDTTIHGLYPPSDCPDPSHGRGRLEDGTKFGQFNISAIAKDVAIAAASLATDEVATYTEYETAEETIALWCRMTGLPRNAAIMVAAEIHNRPTPTIAIVAPF